MAFNPMMSNQGGDWSSYQFANDLKTKRTNADINYHPGTGEKLTGNDLVKSRNVASQTQNPNSLQPGYTTSYFATQLGWRLSAYKGVHVKFISAPSNFNTYLSVDRGALSSFKDEYDSGITRRQIDITGQAKQFIQALSTEIKSVSSPQIQGFFQELLALDKQVANNPKMSGLVYFGGHPRQPVSIDDESYSSHDNPTAFNLLHQIVDGQYFVEEQTQKLIDILYHTQLKDGQKLHEKYNLQKGFFEGRNFLAFTLIGEVMYNLVVMAIGWLNPDTGEIMKDNKTNLGLAGSNDPRDIVKRCLSPNLKNDLDLIDTLANHGFADILRQAVQEFWNEIRGKLIIIFSYGI